MIAKRTPDPEFLVVLLVADACGIVSEVTIHFKLNVTCLHVPSNNIKFTSIMIDKEKKLFFRLFTNLMRGVLRRITIHKNWWQKIRDELFLIISCCFEGLSYPPSHFSP